MPPLTRSPAFRGDSGSQEQGALSRPTRRRHRSPAITSVPPVASKEDSRSTTVEEFAIPQKPVLARAGNVRQDTSILLTAPPASVMTPPAELSFLPAVEPPLSAAVSPRPPSAATQLELELDASLDCRSLDEAEAAQSQILEPPHSSGSSAEAAAALQQSHRSTRLRALSGKQQTASPQPQLEPTAGVAATPTPAPAPSATPTPAPAATPTPAATTAGTPTPTQTPTPPQALPQQTRAPSPPREEPTRQEEHGQPPSPPPEEPEAESAAEPAPPPAPAPTPAPAAGPGLPSHAPSVTRPPVIDLRLDVEGPPAPPGGSRRPQPAGRRAGALLVKPAAAQGRGPLTSRSSVIKGAGRSSSQLQLQAQSQQLQLFPPALPPVDTPRESLSNCLHNLDSHEWEQVLSAMPVLVRLVRHHPDSVLLQAPAVAAALSRHVRNLRSQVARAACQAAGEFFVGLRRTPDLDVEELVGSLFHRSADTNRFLRADCNAALDKMADVLPPARAVQLIVSKGASHQNAVVRTVAARLLAALTARLGADRVLSAPRDLRSRLLVTGSSLLTEGSLDTRCHAKSMFRHLVSHPNFATVLSEVVPQQVLRNISKTLQSLK
ncbi:proline-rich protein 36-like [Schistocerca gregaria]|uniref:proline-rich protein 36-like n=1 Tax=Schistocerca gregaria TaxID=7010 RepID=UPI00211DB742|nr:proline-rich protein 36-like [Schistocerca gregaria]